MRGVVGGVVGRAMSGVGCVICCCRYCEDNPNKLFGSCEVPQEKSDEEIDRAIKRRVRTAGEDWPVGGELAHLSVEGERFVGRC